MEPSNMSRWSDTRFVINAEITFSIRKVLEHKVPMAEMLLAVVLADRECPWWHEGHAARLSLGGSEARLTVDDGSVAVYAVNFQSTCCLVPSQLSAYVKYTAQLAENAHKFITTPEAVCWIGSTVDFQGTNIIFNAEQTARV